MRRCRTRGLPLNSQVPAKHWFLVILFYSQESFSILFSIPVEIRGHVAHTASSVSGHSNEAWSSAAWQEFWEDSLCRLCRKDTNDAERLPLGWRYHWYSLISSTGTSRAAAATLARSGVPSKHLFVAELRNVQKVRLFSGEAPGKFKQ